MAQTSSIVDLLVAWEAYRATHPPDAEAFLKQFRPEVDPSVASEFRRQIRFENNHFSGSETDADNARAVDHEARSRSRRLRLEAGGTPIDGYRLIRLLGVGGFGEVWKASGPGNIKVAIKFTMGDASASERKAFEWLRRLRHPHLVAMHGAFEGHDCFAIIMELADGSMRDALNGSKAGIPRDLLIRQLKDAAEAVDYLHRKRVLHRDIKPDNLLLFAGSVKVADFGLSKVFSGRGVSHTGRMTVAYAAPEFFGDRAYASSDQYSLAVTYCLLRTGRLPFDGAPTEIMRGHLKGQPDLTGLPPQEREIVGKALSKHPKKRWKSCREFLQQLESCSERATKINSGNRDRQFPIRHIRVESPQLIGILYYLFAITLVGIIAMGLVLTFLSPLSS
jgi:serine/threonine protein kinase